MATDLTDDIAAAATAPAEVIVDGTDVKAVPIPDMIQADQYAKANAAAAAGLNPWQMLYPARVVLPGSS